MSHLGAPNRQTPLKMNEGEEEDDGKSEIKQERNRDGDSTKRAMKRVRKKGGWVMQSRGRETDRQRHGGTRKRQREKRLVYREGKGGVCRWPSLSVFCVRGASERRRREKEMRPNKGRHFSPQTPTLTCTYTPINRHAESHLSIGVKCLLLALPSLFLSLAKLLSLPADPQTLNPKP